MKNKIAITLISLATSTALYSQINDSSAIVKSAIEAFYELPSSTIITKSSDSLALQLKLKTWHIGAVKFGKPHYKLSYNYDRQGFMTKVMHHAYETNDSSTLLIRRSKDNDVEFEYEFSAKSLDDSDRISFITVIDDLKLKDDRYKFRCRFLLSDDYKADITIHLNNKFLGKTNDTPLSHFSKIFSVDSSFVSNQDERDSTILNDTLISSDIYLPGPERPKFLAKNYQLLPSRLNVKYVGFKQDSLGHWQEFTRVISRFDTLGRLVSRSQTDIPLILPNVDSFGYYDDGKMRLHLQIRPNYYDDRVETIFSPAGLVLFLHEERYCTPFKTTDGYTFPYCYSDTYFEYSDKNLLNKSTRYLNGTVIYTVQHQREFW